MAFFIRPNIRKCDWARSKLYCGLGITVQPSFMMASLVHTRVCGPALSCERQTFYIFCSCQTNLTHLWCRCWVATYVSEFTAVPFPIILTKITLSCPRRQVSSLSLLSELPSWLVFLLSDDLTCFAQRTTVLLLTLQSL